MREDLGDAWLDASIGTEIVHEDVVITSTPWGWIYVEKIIVIAIAGSYYKITKRFYADDNSESKIREELKTPDIQIVPVKRQKIETNLYVEQSVYDEIV